jgi:hypothetical protein
MHPERLEQSGEVIAGWSRFIAGPQERPVGEPVDQSAHRLFVMEDFLDIGALMARVQDPDGDRVLMDIEPQENGIWVGKTWHGWLLPYVGSADHGG